MPVTKHTSVTPCASLRITPICEGVRPFLGSAGGASGKEPTFQCRRHRHVVSIPGSGRSPGTGQCSHSRILPWRIPWTEEPSRLQFIVSHRVGHDWSDSASSTQALLGQFVDVSFTLSEVSFSQVETLAVAQSPLGQALPGSVHRTHDRGSVVAKGKDRELLNESYSFLKHLNRYQIPFISFIIKSFHCNRKLFQISSHDKDYNSE